jgi:hypothetical protein
MIARVALALLSVSVSKKGDSMANKDPQKRSQRDAEMSEDEMIRGEEDTGDLAEDDDIEFDDTEDQEEEGDREENI